MAEQMTYNLRISISVFMSIALAMPLYSKGNDLSLKILATPVSTEPCLASLLGSPSTNNQCMQWASNVDAAPSVDKRRLVFVGSMDNALHVFDIDTGKPFARIATEGRVITKTLFAKAGDVIYFGTDKGIISCLDAFSFKKIFSFQADSSINNDLMLENNSLVFSTGLATIYSLDNRTGHELWHVERALLGKKLILKSNSNIVDLTFVKDSQFLAVPHPEGYLSIIGASSGKEQRIVKLDNNENLPTFPDIVAPQIMKNRFLWVASFGLGIFVIDPEIGQIRNRIDIKGVSQLASDENTIFGATADELFALALSGEILWRVDLRNIRTKEARYGFPFNGLKFGAKRVFMGVPSTLLMRKDNIIMGSSQGAMGEFSKNDGALLRVVGNSLGFGPKISLFRDGVVASTRRGLLAIFQK